MAKIHTLTYNGTKSSDLGVFVSGSGSFDAAEFDVDKYEIPGRNGDLILSNNRYKNIEITYPAFIPKAFMDKVQNVRNWLRSSKTYARLEDTYDMDHYRLGIPTGVQSFSPENRNDGANFEMTFDCKPQRFLKVGETPETVEADVQTETGEIVTFETVAESPITSASVSLSPIQSGSGDPSPDNIRPISGHTGAELNIAAEYDAEDKTTYSVTFSDQGTVYGGTYDFVTGKLTVTWTAQDIGTMNWTASSTPHCFYSSYFPKNYAVGASTRMLCSAYRFDGLKSSAPYYGDNGTFRGYLRAQTSSSNEVYFHDENYSDAASFKAAVSGQYIAYELATPLEYTLSPQQLTTLLGQNVVWGTGTVTMTYAEPYNIDNPTLFDARPLFTVTNPEEGDVIMVNSQAITFVDGYTGTVYIDCETMNAFSGAANLNSIIQATDFPVLVPGTNIVTWTGAGECTMTPRWWEL